MPRIRIIFEKKEWITFVNHMDLPLIFSRAARRAGLSQEFTQGFSPHPHMSLGPALAIGVTGLAEPAEFWFNEWEDENCVLWNSKLPQGLKILKCAEVDGPALAKFTTAAIYRISGAKSELASEAENVLKDASAKAGQLFACSRENGTVVLTVGELNRCGAGCFVNALKDNGICAGWPDLDIVRQSVGTWDAASGKVLPLI
jgi:uncharacterized protein (DUF2344 family)